MVEENKAMEGADPMVATRNDADDQLIHEAEASLVAIRDEVPAIDLLKAFEGQMVEHADQAADASLGGEVVADFVDADDFLAEEALSDVNEDHAAVVDGPQIDVPLSVDLLKVFENQLSTEGAGHEAGAMEYDDFVEVDDYGDEQPLKGTDEAPAVAEFAGDHPPGAELSDLGEVMAQVDPALTAQVVPEEVGGPQLASILSERFGGASSARECLMQGGVDALREAVMGMKSPLEIPRMQSKLDAVQPDLKLAEAPSGSIPGLGMHKEQRQDQRPQPEFGLMAGLVGGLAGAAAGLTVGLFNGVSSLAVGAAKGGAQVYQGYIDNRNSRDFEQRLADVEGLASEMKAEGADLLDGMLEERTQFFKSQRMEELVKRFSAATDALEQSAARKLAQGLKGGGEPTDLMRQTAERIAEFAERNKQLLEGLQSGGSSMLERFDGITNGLFSALKDALVRLARMVIGVDQQSVAAPVPAPSPGPSMR